MAIHFMQLFVRGIESVLKIKREKVKITIKKNYKKFVTF